GQQITGRGLVVGPLQVGQRRLVAGGHVPPEIMDRPQAAVVDVHPVDLRLAVIGGWAPLGPGGGRAEPDGQGHPATQETSLHRITSAVGIRGGSSGGRRRGCQALPRRPSSNRNYASQPLYPV